MQTSREDEQDWITGFLSIRAPSDQLYSWISTLSAAARDARRATKRDVETGRVHDDERAGDWLGSLGYLVLLDQIGGCFAPRSATRQPPHSSSFARALTHFAPHISDADVMTLYALRCAFAHDYALTNYQKSEPLLTHRFLVVNDASAPLVTYPAVPWTGRYDDRRSSNQTRVNLRSLGNVTEAALTSLVELHTRRELSVTLAGGIDELLARFTLQVRP